MKSGDLVPISPNALRTYRRRLGLSQQALADRAEISRSYISELEAGRKAPRRPVARALAAALGVCREDLFECQGMDGCA
jgi:predicted transcriptional regulator